MKSQYKYNMAFGVTLFILLLNCYSCTSKVNTTEKKSIVILQTSDVHSRIEPISKEGNEFYNKGGFARRYNYVNEVRQNNDDVLLFDCGDISQGTPYYNLYQGELEIKLMNEIGYDAMTIGNHEFDFGVENLARIFSMAKFPILCANYDVSNSPLDGLVKPYEIFDRGGVRFGVFGIGVEPKGLIQDSKCKGVVYKDYVKVADEMAELLKSKGCEVVIALTHIGIEEDKILISKTKNIDFVLGGHSHTYLKEPLRLKNIDGKEVMLMHTGKNGVKIGRIDITTMDKQKN
ncbi:MAG: metallophosphatase [Bacteroides sp.]|nr:metallophosphatase [Bacteroides sp.]